MDNLPWIDVDLVDRTEVRKPDSPQISPAIIEVPLDFPSNYELTEEGDSGSIWIDAAKMSPVGLHFQSAESGVEIAFARPLPDVFAVLGLQLVVD